MKYDFLGRVDKSLTKFGNTDLVAATHQPFLANRLENLLIDCKLETLKLIFTPI